ncbi:TPA: hypothetical protein TVB68_001558 [Streptococcus equi subsp. ruminatorum]|nr:hypothetical protein [Streptococcus equi subsp. ruminatorum]
MSNHLEIVLDIESLEVFDVIDLDEQDDLEIVSVSDDLEKNNPTEEKTKDNSEVPIPTNYERPDYHSPSCILWEVKEGTVIHTLSYQNKHGSYPYHSREPGHWGHVSQLTTEEALWKTLEFNPELMSYV